jgi:hypothetical protein
MYLVYTKRMVKTFGWGGNSYYPEILGPACETRGQAENEVALLKEKGWNATWVELGPDSRYIATTPVDP